MTFEGYMEEAKNVLRKLKESEKTKSDAIFSSFDSLTVGLKKADLFDTTENNQEVSKNAKNIIELTENVENIFLQAQFTSQGVEPLSKFVSAACYSNFLRSKKLMTLEALSNDIGVKEIPLEVYLLGVISFLHKVDEYSLDQAIQLNLEEVLKCQELVENIFKCFLGFSFRNGDLRVKFDSIKYVSKNIQARVYDVSLAVSGGKNEESERKKTKIESTFQENEVEFTKFVNQMEDLDNYRELVIKQTRNVQKGAKRAIFALHRDDFAEASKLIQQSLSALHEIKSNEVSSVFLYMIFAYLSCIEELAEAILVYNWLFTHKAIQDANDFDVCKGPELILSWENIIEFLQGPFSVKTFIGALSDFSGELGRIGVVAAGKNDLTTVKKVVDTMVAIRGGIDQIYQGVPMEKYLGKKMVALDNNLKKMKNILYEVTILAKRREMMES